VVPASERARTAGSESTTVVQTSSTHSPQRPAQRPGQPCTARTACERPSLAFARRNPGCSGPPRLNTSGNLRNVPAARLGTSGQINRRCPRQSPPRTLQRLAPESPAEIHALPRPVRRDRVEINQAPGWRPASSAGRSRPPVPLSRFASDTLHPAVLGSPTVPPRLADLQGAQHLDQVLAIVEQPLTLAQLADHLLGAVPVCLHRDRPPRPQLELLDSHNRWTTPDRSRQYAGGRPRWRRRAGTRA